MKRNDLHFIEISPSISIVFMLQHSAVQLIKTSTWNLLQMSFVVIILLLFQIFSHVVSNLYRTLGNLQYVFTFFVFKEDSRLRI